MLLLTLKTDASKTKVWEVPGMLQTFVTEVGKKLGFTSMEDWYQADYALLVKHGCSQPLKRYHHNPALFIMAVFPNHNWLPWKFKNVPAGWWKDRNNQLMFMEHLRAELGFNTMESLYSLKNEHILKRGGRSLLGLYRDSVAEMLMALYNEHHWQVWKFDRAPRSYYRRYPEVQREFVHWFEKEHKIDSLELWYNYSAVEIEAAGGSALIRMYKGSLSKLLSNVYPDHEWKEWKFKGLPIGWWNRLANQRAFMDDLAKALGITSMEGWYQVSRTHFKSCGGSGLLRKYGSLYDILVRVYPEHQWDRLKFENRVPPGYWVETDNRVQFLEQIAKKIGIKDMSDWYKVKKSTIIKYGGGGLLNKYNTSVSQLLMDVYPHHNWLPWKFDVVPTGFWTNSANRKAFMEWLATQLNFTCYEDYYQLTTDTIINYGGRTLVKLFNGSLAGILKDCFPEHEWQMWKLKRVPLNFWTSLLKHPNPEILSSLVAHVGKELGIKALDDWYRVSLNDMSTSNKKLIRKIGGLAAVLRLAYPKHEWDASRFKAPHKRSEQFNMLNILKKVSPKEDIWEEYILPGVQFVPSNIPIVLDVYMPHSKLALEYQGEQHYREIFYFGRHSIQAQRDLQKIAACKRAGITLVHVPHWWNGSSKSLLNHIRQVRPDIISEKYASEETIPPEPTVKRQKALLQRTICTYETRVCSNLNPSNTEETREWLCEYAYLRNYEQLNNTSQWLYAPHPDGLRALWTGHSLLLHSELTSPSISIPAWFKAALPKGVPLDGFLRADCFDTLKSAIQSTFSRTKFAQMQQPDRDVWKRVHLVVADLPQMSATPLKDRLEAIESICKGNSYLTPLKREPLPSVDYLHEMVDNGCVVLLWNKDAAYKSSDTFIVEKQSTAEVTFVCQHNGMLLCEQDDGLMCLVRCDSSVLPEPESKIRITYIGKDSNGAYKNCVYA